MFIIRFICIDANLFEILVTKFLLPTPDTQNAAQYIKWENRSVVPGENGIVLIMAMVRFMVKIRYYQD